MKTTNRQLIARQLRLADGYIYAAKKSGDSRALMASLDIALLALKEAQRIARIDSAAKEVKA
jgi:hypothetical protein